MQEGKFRIFELKDIPYSSMVMVNSRSWIFSHSFLFVLEPLKGELLRLTYWVCLVAPSSWKPCSHKEKEKRFSYYCLSWDHQATQLLLYNYFRHEEILSVPTTFIYQWKLDVSLGTEKNKRTQSVSVVQPAELHVIYHAALQNLSVHDAAGFRWSPSSKWENY